MVEITDLPRVLEDYLNTGFDKAKEHFEKENKLDRMEAFEIVKDEYFNK